MPVLQALDLSRRAVLAGAACLLTPAAAAAQVADWRALPRGNRSPEGAPGFPFTASYLVDFWKRSPPGATLADDSASAAAPGHVNPDFGPINAYGPVKPTAAQKRIIDARFALIRDRLLAQPSLNDIRGSAINCQARVETFHPGQDEAGRMTLGMGLSFRPINLDDAQTFQRGGRYYTPGEGSTLQININETRSLRNQIVPTFRYGPNALHMSRGTQGVYWVDPAVGLPRPEGEFAPVPLDSVPRGGDPLAISFLHAQWTGGFGTGGLDRGDLKPTTSLGRALAALYMVDWPALVAELKAVR